MNVPFSFYNGYMTVFNRGDEFGGTYFGGPGEYKVKGQEFGPRSLHHIATINSLDLGIENSGISRLPFYYGMCFDGCELEYKVEHSHKLDVSKIDPASSSENWPYASYPEYLPYYPLAVESRKKLSLDEFREIAWVEFEADELVFVVPPNPYLGMSVWGPGGDAEGATIAFIYNFKSKSVRALNICC